jgi:hypothetical protein
MDLLSDRSFVHRQRGDRATGGMVNGQMRRGVSKYSYLLDEDDTFRAW